MIRIKLWLARHWKWYRQKSLYIIADPNDNSITISRLLFEHMGGFSLKEAKVFVFRLCNACSDGSAWNGNIYAFAINPPIEQPTQLADIQFNSKYRTIGFESLNPTVARIFYDYGFPFIATKLSIEIGHAQGKDYYIILPHDKHR